MERFNDAVILCPTDFSGHAAYALRLAPVTPGTDALTTAPSRA